MSRMKYVTRGTGSLYWDVRVTVPAHLRKVVGQSVLKRSTETTDLKEAERLAGPIIAEFLNTIDRAKRGEVFWTTHDLTEACEFIMDAGRTMRHPGAGLFPDQAAFLQYVGNYCKGRGITGQDREQLLAALLEDGALWRERSKVTTPPLQGDLKRFDPNAPAPKPVPVPVQNGDMSLSGFRDHYMPHRDVSEHHASEILRAFSILERITGDISIRQITRQHVMEYRNTLLAYPVGKAAHADKMTPEAIRAATWERTLSPKTVQKYIGYIRTAFDFAINENLMDHDPSERIKVLRQPKTAVQVEPREFENDELRTLFQFPVFVGCLSKTRVSMPGDTEVRDYRYWLPWLGLYTGARLGELCQLERSNLKQDDGVWYLEITTRSDDEEVEKTVKTERSTRDVPVHRHLIKLGFIEYALKQKGRLFPEYRDGKKLAHEYTKQFGYYMDRIELSDPALRFHSLRHTWITEARHANIPAEIWKQMSAHRDSGDVGDTYGSEKRRIKKLQGFVNRIRYEGIGL